MTTTFKYDALHARVLKSNNQGSSTISIGGLYEKRVTSSDTTYAYYVVGERGVVAQIEIDGLGNPHVKGLHDDHLGSAVLVTDEHGVPSTIDFDPWGQKVTYDSNGRPIGVNMSVPGVRIGFTGHDEDDELGLVNMRGRLYDPKQRRFISPDPFVERSVRRAVAQPLRVRSQQPAQPDRPERVPGRTRAGPGPGPAERGQGVGSFLRSGARRLTARRPRASRAAPRMRLRRRLRRQNPRRAASKRNLENLQR